MFICVDGDDQVLNWSNTESDFTDWIEREFHTGRIPADFRFYKIEKELKPRIEMNITITIE